MVELKRAVEAKISGYVFEGLHIGAKAAWEQLCGENSVIKLKELVQEFISKARAEEYDNDVIKDLLNTARETLGGDSGADIAILKRTDFTLSRIAQMAGVGKVPLTPKILHSAIDSLQAYALSEDRQSDGTWQIDARAHLLLAITAMVCGVFGIQNISRKVQWLKLIDVFLETIISSAFIKETGFFNKLYKKITGSPNLFFIELTRLQNALKTAWTDIEKQDLFQPALRAYIDDIEIQVDSAEFNTQAVMGMFWEIEESNMAHGRPRPADLKPSKLISIFIDAMGFTIPDPAQEKTFHCQRATEDYMNLIIAWSQTPDAIANTQKPDPFTFPNDYKPEDKIRNRDDLHKKHAKFLSAFENLVKKERLQLDRNGNVVLYANEKSFIGTIRLAPLDKASIPMGIDKEFLKFNKPDIQSAAEFESAKIAHRKLILETEIYKARTMNAISSLAGLCDRTKRFLDHYGSVTAAIFLQELFPSIKKLLSIAIKHHSALLEKLELIKQKNEAIGPRVSRAMIFVRKIGVNLENMMENATKSKRVLETRLKSASRGKSTMKTELESVLQSLTNCSERFAASNMLEDADASFLAAQQELIRKKIFETKPLDDLHREMAQSILSHRDSSVHFSEPSVSQGTSFIHTRSPSESLSVDPFELSSSLTSQHSLERHGFEDLSDDPITAAPLEPPRDIKSREVKILDIKEPGLPPKTLSYDKFLMISENPIAGFINLVEIIKQEGADNSVIEKLYKDFIDAIKACKLKDKIFNSPAIFKLGMAICKSGLRDYKRLINGNGPGDRNFPEKIAQIIIGIHKKQKFIFKSKHPGWEEYNLYVTNEAGFFKAQKKNISSEVAQIILTQVGDSEFFKMSVVKYPDTFMYVEPILGRVLDLAQRDPGHAGYFAFTPHNNGAYFTLTTKKWPNGRLYVSSLFGGYVCSLIDKNDEQCHLDISRFPGNQPAESNLDVEMAQSRFCY